MGMWTHYCCAEHAVLSAGANEECNWCGQTEQQQKELVVEENIE